MDIISSEFINNAVVRKKLLLDENARENTLKSCGRLVFNPEMPCEDTVIISAQDIINEVCIMPSSKTFLPVFFKVGADGKQNSELQAIAVKQVERPKTSASISFDEINNLKGGEF